MFTKSNDFLAQGVDTLIAGNEKLHVLFATYNTVEGYDSGSVQTHKDGLTIQVQNGNLHYSSLTDLTFFVGTPLADIGAEIMDQEARAVQEDVESSLHIERHQDATFLAVVYAGLSAFREAVEMARKIKRNNPNAKIVLTTCDCVLSDKSDTLSPMLQKKEVDAVVVANRCGGRETMHDILEKIVEVWPAKVAA